MLASGCCNDTDQAATTSQIDTDEVQDEGGSGTRLTTDGSDTDEDKLTPLLDKAYLGYSNDTCYGSKMARSKEGPKDINERTRLCGDDDSLGSRASVVTNTSEKNS